MFLSQVLFVFLLSWQAVDINDQADFLHKATDGDLAQVKAYVAAGVDLEATNRYGMTALYVAARNGHNDLVAYLLDKGAEPNVTDTFYNEPLLSMLLFEESYDLDLVRLLLEKGGKVTSNMLVSATDPEKKDVLALLLKHQPEGIGDAVNKALINDWPELMDALLQVAKAEDLSEPYLNAKFLDNQAMMKKLADAGAKDGVIFQIEDLKPFVGDFALESGYTVNVVLEDGKLHVKNLGSGEPKLRPTSATTFMAVSSQASVWEFSEVDGGFNSLVVKLPHRDVTFTRLKEAATEKPATEAVAEAAAPEDGPRFPEELKKDYKVQKMQQWPSFRGIGARGLMDGQNPPVDWHGPSRRNVLWKTEIPGLAHSSPVVWGDLVFVTTVTNEQENPVLRLGLYGDVGMVNDTGTQTWQVMAVNRKTGNIAWQKTAYAGKPTSDRHPKSTHANSTPAVNSDYIVALFGSEGLYCYDHSGKLIWKRSLGLLSGSFFFDDKVAWGHGSSPIIHNDQVIVQCDRSRDSFLAAFSLKDGKKLWQTERDEVPSWSTPTVYQGKDGVELLTNGTKAVRGYNPKTGDMLWQLKGGSEIAVPTPFEHHGLLIFTNGYRPYQPIYAIRPGQKGDISLAEDATSSDAVVWSHKRGGPYLPTPIAYKDHLYIVDNGGAVSCYSMKDGERLYRERLRGGRAFTASMLAGDDKLYLFSEFGDTFIIQAGPEFKLLAKNSLDEEVMATPAATDGMLFIRARKHLYAIQ